MFETPIILTGEQLMAATVVFWLIIPIFIIVILNKLISEVNYYRHMGNHFLVQSKYDKKFFKEQRLKILKTAVMLVGIMLVVYVYFILLY